MRVPVANPVGEVPKKTKSLKKKPKKKTKNPAALAVMANPHETRSQKMAKKKKKKTKKKKAQTASSPKTQAVTKYVYRTQSGKKKTKKKKRKHKNPSSTALMDFVKVGGGAVLGYFGTGMAGQLIGNMVGGFLGEEGGSPSPAKPFIRPAVEGAITAGVGYLGSKFIPDPLFNLGLFAGSFVRTTHDTVKAVAPGVSDWLSDAMGETTLIPESAYQRALEYANINDVAGDDEVDDVTEMGEGEGEELFGEEGTTRDDEEMSDDDEMSEAELMSGPEIG